MCVRERERERESICAYVCERERETEKGINIAQLLRQRGEAGCSATGAEKGFCIDNLLVHCRDELVDRSRTMGSEAGRSVSGALLGLVSGVM